MNRRIQRFAQALSDARRTGSRSHAPRLLRRALAAGLGAAIAIAALAGQASAVTRSCAWQLQTTADQVNVAYPDEGAYYWTSVLPISPGGHIEIDGQFPHARYTSITTYDEKTQAIDGLHDTQIHPDPGATNPFLPGADRSTVHRSYTVQIVNQQIPATGRAPNTVYTENADGSKSTKNENMAMFILRIYVPDLGTGIDGGLPLPSVSLVSSSGQRTLVPDCPDVVPDTGLNETIAASGTSTALPISNPPVSAPLVWHKYTNLATALVNIDGDGTPFPDAVTPTTDQAFGSGGSGRTSTTTTSTHRWPDARAGARATRQSADAPLKPEWRDRDGHRPAALLVDVHGDATRPRTTGASSTTKSRPTATATTRS